MREWRRTAGHTQADAAALVGVDQSTWGRWESGVFVPSVLEAIAVEKVSKGAIPVRNWRPAKRDSDSTE